jgi:hypothetical protein
MVGGLDSRIGMITPWILLIYFVQVFISHRQKTG